MRKSNFSVNSIERVFLFCVFSTLFGVMFASSSRADWNSDNKVESGNLDIGGYPIPVGATSTPEPSSTSIPETDPKQYQKLYPPESTDSSYKYDSSEPWHKTKVETPNDVTSAAQTAPTEGNSKISSAEMLDPKTIAQADKSGVTEKGWKGADAALLPVDPPAATCPQAVPSVAEVNTAIESCKKKSSFAAHACLGAYSPILQKGVAAAGGVLAAAEGAVSLTNACSKWKQGLRIGNIALTAYNAACTAATLVAKSSCKKMLTAIAEKNKFLVTTGNTYNTTLAGATAGAACMKVASDILLREGPGTTLSKINDDYKWNMISAGVGIAGLGADMLMGKKCEEVTSDDSSLKCTADSKDSRCTAAATDCSNKKNASLAVCICKAKPNAAGCGGLNIVDGGGGNNSDKPLDRTDIQVPKDQSGPTNLVNFGGDDKKSLTADKSSFGATGAPAPGGDSGGIVGGNHSDKKEAVKAGINSGSAGDLGGGGGGGGHGAGGGYGDGDSQYKAYVRGGSKDPHRDVAGVSSQVTGAGGKSNWEKISERYRTNKSSLLDQ